MSKLCINTRDELTIVDLDQIMCFQAAGNYTRFCYVHQPEGLMTMSISKIEQMVALAAKPGTFYRLGRSLLVNQRYLYHINTVKQQLVLGDGTGHCLTLEVPKQVLRNYKELILRNYTSSK